MKIPEIAKSLSDKILNSGESLDRIYLIKLNPSSPYSTEYSIY